MNKHAASEILAVAHKYSALMHESLKVTKASFATEEYEQYRRHVARIMGHMFLNIMVPIYEEHPDLAPDWYNEQNRQNAKQRVP